MARKAKTKPGEWWTPAEVPEGGHLDIKLGSLRLTIGHGHDEWTLATEAIADEDSSAQVSFKPGKGLPEKADERFVFAGESNRLVLQPLLADRPVVIRPRQPVFLLSGQTVTLYLSTPIWLKVQVGDPQVLLKELPTLRQSDTWFGQNTRVGELCYAGRTHARHHIDELPVRPHRALTPLVIHNKANSPLPLEKISLPVPMLALYGDSQGNLWTQGLTLTRESQSDLATVRIDNKPAEENPSLTRLAEPRQAPERGGVTRAFSLLFGATA